MSLQIPAFDTLNAPKMTPAQWQAMTSDEKALIIGEFGSVWITAFPGSMLLPSVEYSYSVWNSMSAVMQDIAGTQLGGCVVKQD